jgi:hypothetical protein
MGDRHAHMRGKGRLIMGIGIHADPQKEKGRGLD